MIATRYLARDLLRLTAAAAAIITLLYLSFDFVESYRLLARLDEGLPRALSYLQDRSAAALWYTLPGALLAGGSLALAGLAQRGELTALFAAGFGPSRVLAVALGLGAAVCAVGYGVGELWMPKAQSQIHAVFRRALLGPQDLGADRGRWLRQGRTFLFMGAPGRNIDEASAVTLFELDEAFQPVRRIDAERMRWRGGQWQMEGARVRELRAAARPGDPNPALTPTTHTMLIAPIDAPPERLRADLGRPDGLTLAELRAMVDWKRRDGQDPSAFEEALSERVAWPLLSLLLPLILVPLVLRARGNGAALALGRAFLVALGCGGLVFAGQTLVRSGTLPPWAGPWLAPAAVAVVGLAWSARLLVRRRPASGRARAQHS